LNPHRTTPTADPAHPLLQVSVKRTFPFIELKDRNSYVTSKTKQYDQEASK
jgi:hypothetical protein